MKRFFTGITALLLVISLLVGCQAPHLDKMVKSRTAIELTGKYNTPDGMCLSQDGKDIYLSMPNFNDHEGKPAKILKIDENDKLSEVVTLPVHPETKRSCPLGIAVGKDGNLYVADNQGFAGAPFKSRVIRVNMKDGKATGCKVVVEGVNAANGVEAYGDYILVCETQLFEKRPEGKPMVSGVYRYSLKELNGPKPVQIKKYNSEKDCDKHLMITFETKDEWLGGIGANGIAASSKGDLYVCNFGDNEVLGWKMSKDAVITDRKPKVIAKGGPIKSCDGMKFVEKCNKILVADFRGNAIHMICTVGGKVTTLASNGVTDGKNGLLDRPSEPCYRKGKVYAANIDLPLLGNKVDAPNTITVLEIQCPCKICGKNNAAKKK